MSCTEVRARAVFVPIVRVYSSLPLLLFQPLPVIEIYIPDERILCIFEGGRCNV